MTFYDICHTTKNSIMYANMGIEALNTLAGTKLAKHETKTEIAIFPLYF